MNRRTFLAVGAATAAAALIPMPAFAATSSYQDAFQRSPGPVTDPPQSPQIHYNVTGMGMPMIENGRVAPTAEGKCYLPFDFLVQPTLVGMDFTLAGSYDPSLPAGQLGGGVTIALGDGKHKSDPSKTAPCRLSPRTACTFGSMAVPGRSRCVGRRGETARSRRGRKAGSGPI